MSELCALSAFIPRTGYMLLSFCSVTSLSIFHHLCFYLSVNNLYLLGTVIIGIIQIGRIYSMVQETFVLGQFLQKYYF